MDIKILNDQLEDINENYLSDLIKICMKNIKIELFSYEEDHKKRLKELKNEIQLETTKLNESIINTSNKEEKLNNSNENLDNSNNSNNSKKENSRSNSVNSDKSHNSRSSRNSGGSGGNKSKASSPNYSRKSSRSNSENNSVNNSIDATNLTENQEGDNSVEEEIKLLEKREIFDQQRIDNIINNQEIVLEIKKFYLEYKKINKNNMNMTFFINLLDQPSCFYLK